MGATYMKAADLPQVIPIFPLDGVLLLPHGVLPLNIFEPRYLNMFDDAMAGDRLIGMIQTRAGGDAERPGLARIGCAGRITSFSETQDGRYLVNLTGISRFMVGAELPSGLPYRQIRAEFAPFEHDLAPAGGGLASDRPDLIDALKVYLERRGLEVDWKAAKEAPVDSLVSSLSMALPFDQAEKQALLEAQTLADREATLIALLTIDGAAGDDGPQSVQ